MTELDEVLIVEKTRMLIAETDGDSRVAWLWCDDGGHRPRPITDARTCLKNLDAFALYGASRCEMETWLRRQV